MLDSGATSNFIQSADGFELMGPSSKTVSTANGQLMRATMTALLPLTQLRAGAREAIVIPELKQELMSVKQLADQGYTTIFHPHLEGVTVHDNDGFKLVISKPPLLQGWREKGGLWTVPLAEEKDTPRAGSKLNNYFLRTGPLHDYFLRSSNCSRLHLRLIDS